MPNHFPKFAYTQNPNLHVGQEIFIIDENKYDIYRAEILNIQNGTYTIFYPDYDMTETIDSIDRILLKNNVNKKIFKEQEMIRMKKEAETNAQFRSESDGESDENEEKNPDIKPPKIPEKFRERTRIQPSETVDRNPLPQEPPKPPEVSHQAVEVAPNITIPITINADDSKVLYDQPKNIEISTSKSSDSNEVTFSFKITFKK